MCVRACMCMWGLCDCVCLCVCVFMYAWVDVDVLVGSQVHCAGLPMMRVPLRVPALTLYPPEQWPPACA